jgi:hypothetical protein
MCVDNTQFRFPLIILDVLVEDVLFDTGSMYNAISLKAFYALAGRFDSFFKCFNLACWNPEAKRVHVVGGGNMPILGTVRLDVTTSEGKIVPIYWAIYHDTEHIIILGTPGMRALGFECKTPNLNNLDLFHPRKRIHHIASAMYLPTLANVSANVTANDQDSQPSSSAEPTITDYDSDNSEDWTEEQLDAMLAANPSAVKYIADCHKLDSFLSPDEQNGLMGGAILKAALENRQPTRDEIQADDPGDFRPQNLPDDSDDESPETPLAAAIRRNMEDFQIGSQSPKPPDYDF